MEANEITALRTELRSDRNGSVQTMREATTAQVKRLRQEQRPGRQRGRLAANSPVAAIPLEQPEVSSRSAILCCMCTPMEWKSAIRVRDSQLLLWRCKIMCKNCPVHQRSGDSTETAIRYRQRVDLLPGLIEFSFNIKWTSWFPSIGISLKTEARVKTLPLYPFFRDLYWKLRRDHIRPIPKEKQDRLFSLARKMLLQAYQSGNASPQDVDENGRTLLHVSTHFCSSCAVSY